MYWKYLEELYNYENITISKKQQSQSLLWIKQKYCKNHTIKNHILLNHFRPSFYFFCKIQEGTEINWNIFALYLAFPTLIKSLKNPQKTEIGQGYFHIYSK